MASLGIKLKDAEIVAYNDDCRYYSGCPTCDYGSEYINEIQVITTNYIIDIEVTKSYEYGVSQGDAIKIFAINFSTMTEKEFVEYVKQSFTELCYNRGIEIKVTNKTELLNKKKERIKI